MTERTDDLTRGDESPLGRTEPADSAADTVAIRADIRETRERMGDTLEEIGDRLNPRHITEQVKDNIRDATIGRVENMARSAADRVTETRHTAMDTIRENPIPAAMAGIGLGWLILKGRKQGAYAGPRYADRYYSYDTGSYAGDAYSGSVSGEPGKVERTRERAVELGSDTRQKASQLADRAQDTAGQVAARAQDIAGTVTEQTRYRARQVEDRFYENPLAVGAAALTLGLAAGLAIPTTRREVELMGDARDQLVDQVREVAQETKDKVQHVAERVMDEAQTTAKQAAREERLT